MNRPRIAIIGASVRAAAQSALRAGCDVVAADLFADADLAVACPATRIDDYPEGFAAWLREVACDGWMYTGALENYPELIERLAAAWPLWGNAGTPLQTCRDPLAVQEQCRRAGIGCPVTRPTADGLPRDGSWLCKTYAGSSGAGTWRLDGAAAHERALRKRAVFQEFVAGNSAAAIFMCEQTASTLIGVTEQLVGGAAEAPWRYVGSIGPLRISALMADRLQRIGELLQGELKLRGIVGVDVNLAGDDVGLIEINPRYTASVEVLERATGGVTTAAHLATFTELGRSAANRNVSLPDEELVGKIHGKAVVYSPVDAKVLPSVASRWLEEALDPRRRTLADIPRAGESIRRGEPLLTVFASGTTIEECRRELTSRVAAVRDEPFGYNDEH